MKSALENANYHIVKKLQDNVTIHAIIADRIYSNVAPRNATYPLIVVFNASLQEILTVGAADRVGSNQVWRVDCVTDSQSWTNAYALADAVDSVLNYSTGTGITGHVYRRAQYPIVENDGDLQYRRVICEYALIAHDTA